ncbi:tetratricopeptide repeat protein [Microvirga rosea]|uniref:tetratricopeptide repeat protein n=1 Tax=Microvirga rosea TaxID=2715425 RepID=UPI001D0A0639|nr:tetratricopeptide repeat protein [Microvirga rosea]MCB8822748.1 hypothetical protein [Microvirga rosea]
MRRPDLTPLDSLDPETRAAAEKAARRAGLSLEDWVATIVARHGDQAPDLPAPEQPSIPGRSESPAHDGVHDGIGADFEAILAAAEAAQRERRPDQASRNAVALEAMALWIEQADERLNEVAQISATQQDRLATTLSRSLSALKGRLEAVENRVATTPEKAQGAFSPEAVIDAVAPVTEEIRQDIGRLRTNLENLATRTELASLNDTFRVLARDLERGPSSKDLLTLAGSVAGLNRKVEALSGSVADNVLRRLGGEIDFIKGKVEELSQTSVDRSVIDFLSSQIVDLRQDLSDRAEPQQIGTLSEAIAGLGRQITEMRTEQVGQSDLTALKSSLEDVCAALKLSVVAQEQSDVPQQLQDMSRRLDILANKPVPEPANLDPIAEQLAVLTERMGRMADGRAEQAETINGLFDRLSLQIKAVAETTSSIGTPLLERFERLEQELRQADTSALGQMLASLQEKLEQSPSPSLHGLEERVAGFSEQLSRMPETYRQTFEEALSHLKNLRTETAEIAERAAASALQKASGAPAATEIEALKAGFVELKALQLRADRKTQETLAAVHEALETLVSRSAPPSSSSQPDSSRSAPDLPSDRMEAAVRRLHASALSQIEDIAAAIPKVSASERSMPTESSGSITSPSVQAEPLGDVRATFIAAARRASRTPASTPFETILQAEEDSIDISAQSLQPDNVVEEAPRPAKSLFERLRKTLDAHRRTLLFGLALLVLGAGTAQVLSNAPVTAASGSASAEVTPDTPPPVMAVEEASGSIVPAAATTDEGGLFDPSRLAGAPNAEGFTTAKFTVNPETLGEIPSGIPGGLRQAALSGDATAVYEIAVRVFEGRGIPRDLALALRLFERAAQAGLAPAQERLAIMYDKALGTSRDVKLAAAWYERAARGGNVRAMHNLATLLAAGIAGRPDYPSALQWYTEAAEAGVRDSQFNVGVLYARGVGTRKDSLKAFHWFALAALQGDMEAVKKRDELAQRLSATDLAAARATVESWRPRMTDPLANDVPARAGDRTADRGAEAASRS